YRVPNDVVAQCILYVNTAADGQEFLQMGYMDLDGPEILEIIPEGVNSEIYVINLTVSFGEDGVEENCRDLFSTYPQTQQYASIAPFTIPNNFPIQQEFNIA